MRLRYVGPHTEVEIAETGQKVERGGIVEVSADLGRALSAQQSWEKVTTRKKKEQPDG